MNNKPTTKTADIIIPIYIPDTKFDRLIGGLLTQTRLPGRIILMVTEKGEATAEALRARVEELTQAHPIPGSGRIEIIIRGLSEQDYDHGATRHLGSTYSDADYLIYMTQDACPADSHLLENLLLPFSDPDVTAVYARQLPDKTDGEIETYTHEFNYPPESRKKTKADIPTLGIKTYFCSNVCAAYRHDIYQELGGFVRHTIFNEDMLMAAAMINAGHAVYYAAEAKVYHSHQYTAKQQFKRNFDLGVSHRQYAEVFGTVKSESEGIRLVKNTARHLIRKKKLSELPKLFVHSACKYAGYLLGTHYDKLPKKMIKACSLCRHYWK